MKKPRVLAWAALGMRDAGIGEYVELRDYERLEAEKKRLEEAVTQAMKWDWAAINKDAVGQIQHALRLALGQSEEP